MIKTIKIPAVVYELLLEKAKKKRYKTLELLYFYSAMSGVVPIYSWKKVPKMEVLM